MSGSLIAGAPVCGVGETVDEPVIEAPPFTLTYLAVRFTLPEALKAEPLDELTSTPQLEAVTCTDPDMEKALAADGSST